jgi:hypothetical protein
MADLPTYKVGGAPCNDAVDTDTDADAETDAGLYRIQSGNEAPMYGLFHMLYY